MTTASMFSLLGLPFAMVITVLINFYLDYCVIYHFILSMFATSGWYDDEQNEKFSIFNWWFESVIWWSFGTRSIVLVMLLNHLVPFIGPMVNLFVVILSYFVMYE